MKRVKFQEDEISRIRFLIVDMVTKHTNIRNAMHNVPGSPFGITESKFKTNDTQLLRVQEFESMMANFIGTSKFGDRRYKVLDEKIGLILKLIEGELKK